MFKFKTCELMQYLQYYDTNDINVIVDRIKSLTNLKRYALVLHDKDKLENGELKKPHFHAVLTFSNSTTSNVVANVLHLEEQYINKIKSSTKSALLYLVHKNNPEKYQYNASSVISNFDYVEFADDCLPKQNRLDIANRIVKGEIKEFNLHEFISVDEFSKNKVYYDRCFSYRQSLLRSTDRHLDCVFVSGASGCGKTTFAKDYALAKGYSVYISSGGTNPLDNYQGQDCIILDDIRDSTFKMSDFLKLTDNNTNSLVGCRYFNKNIYECKLLIVTSILDIRDFYSNAIKEDNEPQLQLFRRFATMVIVDKYVLSFYSFNGTDYTLLDKYKNYISDKFIRVTNSDRVCDIVSSMSLSKINKDDLIPIQLDLNGIF